jgi:hypothetical protein
MGVVPGEQFYAQAFQQARFRLAVQTPREGRLFLDSVSARPVQPRASTERSFSTAPGMVWAATFP